MGQNRARQIQDFLKKENIKNYSALSKFIYEYNNYPADKNFFKNKCSEYCSSVLYLDRLFRENKIEKLKNFFLPHYLGAPLKWEQTVTDFPFIFTQTSTADEFKQNTEDLSDVKALEDMLKDTGVVHITTINLSEDNGERVKSKLEEGFKNYKELPTVSDDNIEPLNHSSAEFWNISGDWRDINKINFDCNTQGDLKNIKKPLLDFNKDKGLKHNSNKLEMSRLFEQFPDALQAIVLCSTYGAQKYKEINMWDNFRKVKGGSKTYIDAAIRHLNEGLYNNDEESNFPHIFHASWNLLAALELYCNENINIKNYSQTFLKELQNNSQ